MKRIGYIISIVLLCGLAVEKASALSYVLSDATIKRLEGEHNALIKQRQQTQADITNLCSVLSNPQRMYVYSLNGSKRWECWTTQQVADRLGQMNYSRAQYYGWWNYLQAQHRNYWRYARNQLLPSLQARLKQIDARLTYIARTLSSSTPDDRTGGLSNVTVNMSPIYVYVWDHGKLQDGDVVEIFVNGKLIRQVSLTRSKTRIKLPLPYGNHRLEVRALNTGASGPNTASMSITGVVKGNPKQSWNLQTGERATMWITVGR
ncbi:MAG: hypothetical protein QGG42_07165 [Phycisphaerae bacterium]|nr:hypothetical protein [Phycisphaerae bacterium]